MRVAVPEQGFRRVMHCDLDCFFAAVEELDMPSLAGKPVIVGGDPDRRGVVSTANYAARRFGIHSAMSAAQARRLCPGAVFLRPRFDRYRELSQQVMAILDDYFVVRERVSIDEAYGELTPGLHGCRPAETIAREIRARVRTDVGLAISIGAGPSKSIAKLASDLAKPDGYMIIKPGTERDFLRPLPVGRLHGVGPQTRERLERNGITTIGQLADRERGELERLLGKHGHWLWQLANGTDERPVIGDHGPPKSVSREQTYERDIADASRAAEQVAQLAHDVARYAAEQSLVGRTVTLKVRWADFRLMTRQTPLSSATCEAGPIAEAALALLKTGVVPRLQAGDAIRLLGVGLSGIVQEGITVMPDGLVQLPLFESH